MKSNLQFSQLIFGILLIGFASCKKAKVNPVGKNLVLTSFEAQKVFADNGFAIKLFKNLDSANTAGGNLFISPLSVSFALGMTSNGANGNTLTAFKNTLDFAGLTQAQVNTYYNSLITNLPELDPNTTVNIANSIWYQQGFTVLPQFLQTNNSYFHAQVQSLDFSSPSSVTTINNWVNTETNGKIPSIINQVPSNVIMYLVNAMYFKSSWNEKFDPAQTKPMPFYLADNSTVQANFMNGMIDMNTYFDGKESVFELPYSNSRYSMVIVMPSATTGPSLHDMVAGLDSAQWQSWMSQLHPIKTQILMPKFQYTYSALLNNPLTSLGLGVAFSDKADFSLINATVPLQISQVMHKAYIETDESGSTAAAATSVSVGLTAISNPPPAVIDHPFLFAIRQMSSGLILFVGTMNNPSQQGN